MRRDSAYLSMFLTLLSMSAGVLSLCAKSWIVLFVLCAFGFGALAILIGVIAFFELRARADYRGEWISMTSIFLSYTTLSLSFIGIANFWLWPGLAVIASIFFVAIGAGFILAAGTPAVRTIGMIALVLSVIAGLGIIKVHQLRVDARETQLMNRLRNMGMKTNLDEIQRKKRLKKAREFRSLPD